MTSEHLNLFEPFIVAMSFFKYARYFYFILRNWNIQLACFTVWHEIRGERKYHINTTDTNDLKKLEVKSGNKESAFIYQPANYFMLEKALNYISESGAKGNLVDYGCGKGRIMAVAAAFRFKKITGIEFAPALCEAAQENIDRISHIYPDTSFRIHCCDATEYRILPSDCVFTFFNPFDERVMLPVVRKILASLKETPRPIFIAYFNPTERELFLSAGFEEVWHYEKMSYLDFSIFMWDREE
ncbi:MAG: class I SAM-dependent methyltransferase [Chitinophagaceae bacterium]|nr:class I SAM-dependent methyltransferase [Chitinophagaceae bacterium]MCZ2395095.1 class I SAM-dependent methyltransferase [Chitinophagales bacterium]